MPTDVIVRPRPPARSDTRGMWKAEATLHDKLRLPRREVAAYADGDCGVQVRVAEAGGTVLGWVAWEEGANYTQLHRLVVAPRWRWCGVGSQLLACLPRSGAGLLCYANEYATDLHYFLKRLGWRAEGGRGLCVLRRYYGDADAYRLLWRPLPAAAPAVGAALAKKSGGGLFGLWKNGHQ